MFQRLLNLSESNSFFLFGARGTGKTTLLNKLFDSSQAAHIDLLDSEILAQLQARPDLLRGIIERERKQWCIIDEIQKIPPLLDIVHQVIENSKQKFALTGSSARKLKRGSANLLAGRAFVFNLFPLTHIELGESFKLDAVLSYGSLPKVVSFLDPRDKRLFLKAYAETYLKEEILIEQLIRKLPPFRKFLEIAAHQDTEIVSYSKIARDILVDPKIVSNYYEILQDTLLGFMLEPYHTSIRKRQKKSPKFYWFDTGVRRALSGNLDYEITPRSFEYGSLFENFTINEISRLLSYSEKSHRLSFVRLDDDIEVDLVIERSGLPTFLVEIKSTDRINETHTKNVRKVSNLIENSRPYVLSRDPVDRVVDGVSCLYWQRGLVELGVCG